MQVFWFEQTLADVRVEADWLSSAEVARLVGLRIPKRREDWSLGRWTAKNAVAVYLELPRDPSTLAAIEIRPAKDGAPEVFFQTGPAPVSISLSHRDGRAACAIAPSGSLLGCDLEVVEPRCGAFVADYFTPDEQKLVGQAPEPERFHILALLWSAKESTLKALRTGLRLDTRDIAVGLGGEFATALCTDMRGKHCNSPEEGTWHPLSTRHADELLLGWWQVEGDVVRTVVSVPAPAAPISLRMVPDAMNPIL